MLKIAFIRTNVKYFLACLSVKALNKFYKIILISGCMEPGVFLVSESFRGWKAGCGSQAACSLAVQPGLADSSHSHLLAIVYLPGWHHRWGRSLSVSMLGGHGGGVHTGWPDFIYRCLLEKTVWGCLSWRESCILPPRRGSGNWEDQLPRRLQGAGGVPQYLLILRSCKTHSPLYYL